MAEKNHTLDLLNRVDIFAGLTKTELKDLSKIAQTKDYTAGKIVFRQNDPSDSFHVVESGTFDVFLWDDLLQIERPIDTMGRGEMFGEMGALTNQPRSAYVRCKEKGRTICFDKEAFLESLCGNPKVAVEVAKTLAHRLHSANQARRVPFENISRFRITAELVELLPLQVILRHQLLPLKAQDDKVIIGMVNPTDLVARNIAGEFLGGYQVEWVCVSQPDFENFRDKQLFDLVESVLTEEQKEGPQISFETGNLAAAADVVSPAAKLLNRLLEQAIEANASDLHLEPGPKGAGVRGRIDGKLVEQAPTIQMPEYKPLVSRVKVLCDLDITETRLPQEASIRANYGDRHLDIRVSTLPTPRGESVVFRLLDPTQRRLNLKDLFVNDIVADLTADLFKEPSGLMLVTGPTGSGKTTTLYAGIQTRLKEIPTNKLITAEDPVEYEFPNATQVQVNPMVDLTFAAILRSLLRQDPDVVLVGEMRDQESMDIAFEAALTGHFVMSSLHTNSAFETIHRLRQRRIEPYVIAASLKGILTQRLIPKLCAGCVEEIRPEAETAKALRQSGLIGPKEKPKVWGAQGCSQCRMTGRKGRVAVFEILLMSDSLRDAIEREATWMDLQKAAPPETFLPMRRYAKYLLEKGLAAPADLLEIFPSVSSVKV